MKKNILVAIIFMMMCSVYSETKVYPAYGKIYASFDNIDRSEYKEVTFQEAYEIHDKALESGNVEMLRSLKFKTKCHITSARKVHGTNWQYLSLYCDGKEMYDFQVPKANLFLYSGKFEGIEVYYHYAVYVDGTVERKDDGLEILKDIRFPGMRYVAADNLKIRKNPSLDSEKIGLILKNEFVTVLKTGEKVQIDRMESAWVKVRTKDGKEGWSFGGYLTDGKEYILKYPWEN